MSGEVLGGGQRADSGRRRAMADGGRRTERSFYSFLVTPTYYLWMVKFINFVELVLVELNLSVNLLMLVHHLKIQGYLG